MGGVGRKESKEESGRVESGDRDVERKLSVKVFSNKRITMQRSLCTSSPRHSLFFLLLLCHCHSLHPSFPSLIFLSVLHCALPI